MLDRAEGDAEGEKVGVEVEGAEVGVSVGVSVTGLKTKERTQVTGESYFKQRLKHE